ncbi:MAG: helix-turn-helix domain-containing protein [Rhodococcus sp.]|nr:helix-turn-helix domain-containing protein [Rhodococcus sp. (in: high G+C Gram-positive bacteria)]
MPIGTIRREPSVTVTTELPTTVMGRVTALLAPFRDAESLTLTELARHTGFPRSSAHRMLLQLVQVGWIDREGTSYRLGAKFVELGGLARSYDGIHRAALPVMHGLWHSTGLVVQLAVLDGDSVLYLEKTGGRRADDVATRVGERRPVQSTFEGRALSAHRGGTPSLHEGHAPLRIRPTGVDEPARCIAAAFDSGCGETAAISVTGIEVCEPRDVGRLLRDAVAVVAMRSPR